MHVLYAVSVGSLLSPGKYMQTGSNVTTHRQKPDSIVKIPVLVNFTSLNQTPDILTSHAPKTIGLQYLPDPDGSSPSHPLPHPHRQPTPPRLQAIHLPPWLDLPCSPTR